MSAGPFKQPTQKIAPLVLLHDVDTPVERPDDRCLLLPQIPSPAFGDGTHPTTRLCAGAVDLLCRQQPGLAFLDVGTGTGVLARIARARQATHVTGTDIDLPSLVTAQKNAALDAAATEIIFQNQPPDHWGERFDLIAANILEEPLCWLGSSMVAALKPGGRLLLSGFTPPQAFSLRTRFTELGMVFVSESRLEGWSLLLFKK